ncbi:MAG TPA: serine--tRNA ligase [Ignavibacteriales bacterium]|nr:serine--tRNA ligase [Ignavibacteriales bacterium]HOL80650.1 serine--tRNA ligase [Ignavibacteriales bacterium]HOM64338.1 serine--tRNA ligase [Ignavibacteriales bacterium]HPD67126.1 serine--tRNA ligase [Ignavibacteriales bacterium]HPP33017.1 serine--tRNA ligase [Ignavibacteriales bacterium]
MLDIKFIRQNPDIVKNAVRSKNQEDKIDELLELDKKRREILTKSEELKSLQNKVSKEIAQYKKENKDATEVLNKMKSVAEEIKTLDSKLSEIESKIDEILRFTPNMPHSSVPIGKDASENVEIRRWVPEGLNIDIKKDNILDHIEIGKKHNILDFERGAKLSGSGFPLYKGKGATLERALINFMLDYHLEKHNYTEIFPPFLVNKDSMYGTGQLPKFAEDMYCIEKDELYPVPTAEVPITNIFRNEILNEEDLPIYYVGYSACFRREAGSYGKESKGFLRVHQFNKVEMVKFAHPDNSYDELEKLVNDAEDILKALKIPYRVILLCSGDLSFSAAKCYDIETWSPAENKWLEASSCSNFEAFQARRANIRFRKKDDKKLDFVHTLNGSGLATSRLMVSILENYQQEDGSIIVPEVLRPYTKFDVIK